MSEKQKLKFKIPDKIMNSKLVNKLKKIKHIEFIVAGIFILVLILIYYSNFSSSSTSSTKYSTTASSSNYSSTFSYANELESKLNAVLSKIDGAGNVTVMITLKSSVEKIIATNTEEKSNTSSNGSNKTEQVTVVKDPIIVTQNGSSLPLILMEVLPKVSGVIVVAQGAKDIRVRLNLLDAVKALLSVDSQNIQIFAGN